MAYLTRADFIGEYRIAVDSTNLAKVNEIISQHETPILIKLFGSSMLLDLLQTTPFGGANPITTEQDAILKQFVYVSSNKEELYSEGLKVALAKMLFMPIDRDQKINNSSLGNRQTDSEVGSGISTTKTAILYNQGVRSMRAIQRYISLNKDSYPNYNGCYIEFMGMI